MGEHAKRQRTAEHAERTSRRNVLTGPVLGLALALIGGAVWVQAAKNASMTLKDGGMVTIDVKDTDISRVLDAFSQQTGLSVVVGREVSGTVSVRLVNVQWDQALDAVLKPYGFGFERNGDVIIVLPIAKLNELNDAQPLSSRVFQLRYVDANDVKPVIEAQLSARGRVQVLEVTGQKGWEFGMFGASGTGSTARSGSTAAGRPSRGGKAAGERRARSKQLVVTDIPAVIDRVAHMVAEIDSIPQQVLIESRFMEVARDRLKDIGVELSTGATGTDDALFNRVAVDKSGSGDTRLGFAGHNLAFIASSAASNPKSDAISTSGFLNTGLGLRFQKLTGTQFDILLHALEEDVHTNTLSAPSIMTLDNQEANILVGTQFPILTASVAGTTSTTTVTSLDYYQDIGVQLRVVPQIAGANHINMIVHPTVSSFTSTLAAKNAGGFTLAEYPILDTREAETQILVESGDTIVIAGLTKDIKTQGFHKIPLLGDIPWLGIPFRRETNDVEKVELLIFVTAKIFSEEQVATQPPAFSPNTPGPKTTIQWREPAEAATPN